MHSWKLLTVSALIRPFVSVLVTTRKTKENTNVRDNGRSKWIWMLLLVLLMTYRAFLWWDIFTFTSSQLKRELNVISNTTHARDSFCQILWFYKQISFQTFPPPYLLCEAIRHKTDKLNKRLLFMILPSFVSIVGWRLIGQKYNAYVEALTLSWISNHFPFICHGVGEHSSKQNKKLFLRGQ